MDLTTRPILRVVRWGLAFCALVGAGCEEPFVTDTAIVLPLVCELGTEDGGAIGNEFGAECQACDYQRCGYAYMDKERLESICLRHPYSAPSAKNDGPQPCSLVYVTYGNCCMEAMSAAWTTAAAAAGCPEEAACDEPPF